jgi:hypothetical protein
MGLVPNPYIVCHIVRKISDQTDPDTGNNVIVDLPPVIRKAQSFSQIGRMRGSSKIVLTPEYLRRISTELHMSVDDPELYGPQDQVLLFPEVDQDGDYIPGTGFAFWIDGLVINSKTSPWPSFTRGFGGLIRLRRTT